MDTELIGDEEIALYSQDQGSFTKDAPKYAGLFSTMLNLLNSVLGAGVLSISNSFTFCGLVPSVIMLTACAVLSFISAAMVTRLQYQTNADSLPALCQIALGKIGSLVMSISMIFFCLSCMTAYIIMGTEIIQSWAALLSFDLKPFLKRAALVLVYAFCLPIAITIPRDISFLGYVSFSCFAALFVFAGGIIYKGIDILPKKGFDPTVEIGIVNINIFNALGIYSLAFALSTVIIPIIRPMEPNLRKRYIAAGGAFFMSYCVVLIPGVVGYLLFGRRADAMILNNFPDSDILFVIVRGAVFIVLLSSYPMIGLPVIGTVSKIIYKTENHQVLPWGKRAVCLVLENAIPLLIAIFLPNVRPAMAIGGALGGGVSNFVLPPLMWIFLTKGPWHSPAKLANIVFFLFGIVASAIATFEAVLDAVAFFTKKN